MRTMKKNRLLLLVCFVLLIIFLLLFQMAQRLWEKQIFGRRCLILIDQTKSPNHTKYSFASCGGSISCRELFCIERCIDARRTRNPLADSGLLGINAGASLAMALSFAFWPKASDFSVFLMSLAGSFAVTLLVFGFCSFRKWA